MRHTHSSNVIVDISNETSGHFAQSALTGRRSPFSLRGLSVFIMDCSQKHLCGESALLCLLLKKYQILSNLTSGSQNGTDQLAGSRVVNAERVTFKVIIQTVLHLVLCSSDPHY